MGFWFTVFPIIHFLIFAVAFGIIAFVLIKGISQWNKNNHSPKITVSASVVSKRTSISHSHHGTGMHHTSTFYYVTFQFDSGDRTEFCVPSYEFGLMVEGDRGMLTFQGTRFLSFVRS